MFSLQFPGREVNCGNHTAESCSDCNWVKQEKSRLMVKNHNNQNTSNAQNTYFRWAKNGAVVNVHGGPIIARKFDQLSTSSCLLLSRKIFSGDGWYATTVFLAVILDGQEVSSLHLQDICWTWGLAQPWCPTPAPSSPAFSRNLAWDQPLHWSACPLFYDLFFNSLRKNWYGDFDSAGLSRHEVNFVQKYTSFQEKNFL